MLVDRNLAPNAGQPAAYAAPSRLARAPRNRIALGDCCLLLQQLPSRSVDLVLTDPPYLVNYVDRCGRSLAGDRQADWLIPSFAEVYRVLRADSVCVSFYGWSRVAEFIEAWRAAGFRLAGHLTFVKAYASSSRLLRYQHENAYLLAKGLPPVPASPIPDVIDFPYSGNKLHPTQKPVAALMPLIEAFCPPGGLVLDPFAGSGSALIAALSVGRDALGIEIDAEVHAVAQRRFADFQQQAMRRPASDRLSRGRA